MSINADFEKYLMCFDADFEKYLVCLVAGGRHGYVPGWYFIDEARDLNGPFATHDEALNELKIYCVTLGA